ncbi:hypothetical protein [Serratia marcescens]|uniref:hypothetical protein n=2 Tax=Serratia marcescens TaxID=615 RepID=UPI00237F232D|nr:hypothetical protein [Serratia marcescens]
MAKMLVGSSGAAARWVISTGKKVVGIADKDNNASGVKVWILTGMVGVTMAVVAFFGNRLVNTVDTTESAIYSVKEVQAAQGEALKGLQRDQERSEREAEELKKEVGRLKDENATLKGRLNIPLTLNSTKAASGQLFLWKN